MKFFGKYLRQSGLFNRALKIMLVTNAMILVAGAMIGPIYALFVQEQGGDLLDASFTGAAYALAAGITTLVSGKYSDKIKENELVIVLGYAIMGFAFLFFMVAKSIFAITLIQMMIGFGEAIYSPAFDAVYSKHLDLGKSGRQWGAWESMNYFSMAFGSIVGGFIVTGFNFNVLFMMMATLCFASAFYIYFLPRKVL